MQYKTQERKIFYPVWVADDGSEFSAEKDCLRYEKKLKIANDLASLKCSSNNNLKWYLCKDIQDLLKIKTFYNFKYGQVPNINEATLAFPDWFTVNEVDEDDVFVLDIISAADFRFQLREEVKRAQENLENFLSVMSELYEDMG